MKIVFINISLRPDNARRLLPVGLAYILTAVKRAGFEFDFIDMDVNNMTMQDLEDTLAAKIYDVYAFGCIVTGYKFVRQIGEIIKRVNPQSVVVAGNSVATAIPEILLNNTKVDIAVMGEGDITIIELLRALDLRTPLSDVKGIVFRKDGDLIHTDSRPIIPELDSIGFPDWEIFELDKYAEYAHINANILSADHDHNKVKPFPLTASRGCTHNCTFCYHVFKGKKYRKYSEEAVAEEIKRLYYHYQCNFITFWDELTFPSVKSVEAMVSTLETLDFKFGWDAPVRGNLFKEEHVGLIKRMKDTGCDNLVFSLENASAEILAAMNKKLDVSQFIEQAKTLWKGGCVPRTSIIFGYPQETPETIKKTIDVCEECNIYPSVGFLLPLPGTSIYEWAKTNGYITDEVSYLEKIGDRQDLHINLTSMSDSEFLETIENRLRKLADKFELKLESVLKTVTYRAPKRVDAPAS